jgi:hypothetical protein
MTQCTSDERRNLVTAALLPLSHPGGARDGDVQGGRRELRPVDPVAGSMATEEFVEGFVESALISVRMRLRAAPCPNAAHRSRALSWHRGPADRAAPRK